VEIAISSSAEVRAAAESLDGRFDALASGQDNTAASAFDAVVKTARDARLPLFPIDATAVERGGIASFRPEPVSGRSRLGEGTGRAGAAWAEPRKARAGGVTPMTRN
jgi:ABC transporter substrate binding protein